MIILSKADRLFEELGYKKFLTGYLSPNMKELYGKADKRICFWLDKTIEAYDFYDGGETITMEDLQAINEKVKELRLDRRRR